MDDSPPLYIRFMPRRFASRCAGWLGRRRLPAGLLQCFLRWYVDRFDARMDEATKPLEDYETFVDFFTRPLKPGARPIPEDPTVLISPCDGQVSQCGKIEQGLVLQVKNHWYSVADLLGSPATAADLDGGQFLTLYLAPGDYHRYHWPFDGKVHTVRHIPGDLWPVNERSVNSVPNLFAVNERVAVLGTMANGTPFAYVPVGALNVGSIKLDFCDVHTNRPFRKRQPLIELEAHGKRGDEFGLFEFGSTVVLLIGPGGGGLTFWPPRTPFRMGDPIGTVAGRG